MGISKNSLKLTKVSMYSTICSWCRMGLNNENNCRQYHGIQQFLVVSGRCEDDKF